jgi:hypothetical protein
MRCSDGAPIIGLGGALPTLSLIEGGAICGAANAKGKIAKRTATKFILFSEENE